MAANESSFVVCRNGLFTLPESVYRSLLSVVGDGFVYTRQDEDVLTISTTKIVGGRRRTLNTWVRSPMFLQAQTLAVMNLRESVRVMAVADYPIR